MLVRTRFDQVTTLLSLGQVQAEEGHRHDAVDTYFEVLRLQQNEDADEVADAHFQASERKALPDQRVTSVFQESTVAK